LKRKKRRREKRKKKKEKEKVVEGGVRVLGVFLRGVTRFI